MKRSSYFCFLTIVFATCLTSCTVFKPETLKPYERIYVNDPDMQMGELKADQFKNYVFSIREGGLNAVGTKAGGGCGCN